MCMDWFRHYQPPPTPLTPLQLPALTNDAPNELSRSIDGTNDTGSPTLVISSPKPKLGPKVALPKRAPTSCAISKRVRKVCNSSQNIILEAEFQRNQNWSGHLIQ